MAGTNQITWENKVNTKTLDIPRINKIIDEDLNEIKTKFNALDTIVTDPVIGIPAQSDQFTTNEENITSLATIYIKPELPIVDFSTSGLKGDVDLPVYDSFSIIGVVKGNRKNQWELIASFESVPTIISSPDDYLDITGTILVGYENLNRLHFLLDYNDSGVLKVFLTITQMPDANQDPDPPIA
jgi:hypothetical protein